VVDAGNAGRNHVPVRIVTPRGKAAQARYAAQVTATIIDRLEDYFGVPYPYEKLDEVAIPLTFGFGAMENAGLVTYGQDIYWPIRPPTASIASALMPRLRPMSWRTNGPATW